MPVTNEHEHPPAWDLFISHASEDKKAFVAPLATELSRLGLRVWYDDFSLQLGDSLSASIDRGLAESEFGLVVLSKHFIEKPWPKRELAGLVAGEMGEGQVIVPVWFGITRPDVYSFSPPLADRVAIVIDAHPDIYQTAIRVVERVKPQLFEAHQRRAAYDRIVANATPVSVPIDELQLGPIRHGSLSDSLTNRIRLMREVLLEVNPCSWRETVDNFRRDMNPEQELVLWEYIASIYLTVVNEFDLPVDKRRILYEQIFSHIAAGTPSWSDEMWARRARELSELAVDPLADNYGSVALLHTP